MSVRGDLDMIQRRSSRRWPWGAAPSRFPRVLAPGSFPVTRNRIRPKSRYTFAGFHRVAALFGEHPRRAGGIGFLDDRAPALRFSGRSHLTLNSLTPLIRGPERPEGRRYVRFIRYHRREASRAGRPGRFL